jgi:hypothetical protein
VLFIVSVLRKQECPICQTDCLILVFEFLSRFFVNLPLVVLQVIVVACFIYKVPGSLLNMFCAYLCDKTRVFGFSNRTVRF